MSTNTVKALNVRQSMALGRSRTGKLWIGRHAGKNVVVFRPDGPGHSLTLELDTVSLSDLRAMVGTAIDATMAPEVATAPVLPVANVAPEAPEAPAFEA